MLTPHVIQSICSRRFLKHLVNDMECHSNWIELKNIVTQEEMFSKVSAAVVSKGVCKWENVNAFTAECLHLASSSLTYEPSREASSNVHIVFHQQSMWESSQLLVKRCCVEYWCEIARKHMKLNWPLWYDWTIVENVVKPQLINHSIYQSIHQSINGDLVWLLWNVGWSGTPFVATFRVSFRLTGFNK